MTLTKQDLTAIGNLMDERLDIKLEKKLEEKLTPIREEIKQLEPMKQCVAQLEKICL